jgi:hypothetical protein
MGLFCLGFLHRPKFFFNLQKGEKRKRRMHNPKYIGLYIYHAFCFEKEHQQQQQHQQSKEICDYRHGNNKRIKAHFQSLKIPPLTPPPTLAPT